MPIYEYRCRECGRKTSRIWTRLPSAAEERGLLCPSCGVAGLSRLFSRFAAPKSAARRTDDALDAAAHSGLDENDPRGMARLMRKMSEESGEPIAGEDAEMLDRMEAGEMPDEPGAGDT